MLDANSFLPEGFEIDTMSDRELVLVSFFLEDQYAVLDEHIEKLKQIVESGEPLGPYSAYQTIDNEICVPGRVLRRAGYEQGDGLETHIEDGDLFIRITKKEWESPDWLKD